MNNLLTNAIARRLAIVVAIALTSCLQGRVASADPNDGERGKIYMLFVWTGTSGDAKPPAEGEDASEEYLFRKTIETSRKYFESNLSKIGLDGSDKDVFGASETLSGSDTTPQKIVDAIRELSQKAGEEDALFVYICSHGWALDPGQDLINPAKPGETGEKDPNEQRPKDVEEGDDREHLVAPYFKTAPPVFSEQALTRANILHYMRSRKHRLDVLVTDSCSSPMGGVEAKEILTRMVPAVESESETGGASSETTSPQASNFALRYLLARAEGTVSWNSSNPCSYWYVQYAYETGELTKENPLPPMAYKEGDLTEKRNYGDREQSHGDSWHGTVFTNAFIRAASRPVTDPNAGYTFDDFFLDLGMDYDNLYDSWWLWMAKGGVLKLGVGGSSRPGFHQGKTTLTQFNVEDDYSDDSAKNVEIAAKTNNRVLKSFDHRDQTIVDGGSLKVGAPTIDDYDARLKKTGDQIIAAVEEADAKNKKSD